MTRVRVAFVFILTVPGILLVSRAGALAQADDSPKANTATGTAAPEPIAIGGIENTFRLSPRLYSGGDPRGAEALGALRKLGVKTVISVDGGTPDVDEARRLGLRYVHLPVGYDGITREQAARIIKAARTLPGPVYVHCHHGKHRGPTAAALCALADEGWNEADALAWLERAGTARDYRGLFATVREFRPPSPSELDRAGTSFPERVPVPALVEMMVQVDGRFDRLKAAQKAGFQPPADHPDIDPPHEALQLVELFREAARLDEAKERGEPFLRALARAEREATALQESLRAFASASSRREPGGPAAALSALAASCTACHAHYRDN